MVMILVRIHKLDAKGVCHIPGYEKFFPVDSIDLGAENAMNTKGSGSDNSSNRDFVVKKEEPEKVKIDRISDSLTPALMGLAIKNRTVTVNQMFWTIDVSFVQLRHDLKETKGKAGVKAYLLMRFGGARLVSWNLSGSGSDDPKESIEFKYTQIAIQYRATQTGDTYIPSTTYTWDFEKNEDWTEPPEWK